MLKSLIALFAFLAIGCTTLVQSAPAYWSEMQAFQLADRLKAPPEHPILFIGSSSFTLWTSAAKDLNDPTILNRAFGGSTLLDVIENADQVIKPYHPRQVVIYCGENDAAMPGVKGADVADRFKILFGIIRQHYPNVQVSYVSIKASPSRAEFFPVVREANQLIAAFLATRQNTSFIDVHGAMLDTNGKPRAELFGQDRLHMTAQGYAIWIRIIAPFLLKA
ncbi:MAG: GDSL-type esterase/lipase family protein [Pseudomonadota bacterium]